MVLPAGHGRRGRRVLRLPTGRVCDLREDVDGRRRRRCCLETRDGPDRQQGYSRDDAVPIEGDSLRHRVAWKEHGLDNLPAGPYLIRLHLDGATLFAVSYR